MCLAWAWDDILSSGQVSLKQVYAFQYVVRRFREPLAQCQWPDPAEFPYVVRSWDSVSDGQLELQYMVLCHNVLSLSVSPLWHRLWFPVRQVRVCLVKPDGAVLAAFQPLWTAKCGWPKNLQRCVAHLVGKYLVKRPQGEIATLEAFKPLWKRYKWSQNEQKTIARMIGKFMTAAASKPFVCSIAFLRRVGFASAERGLRRQAGAYAGERFAVLAKNFPGSVLAGHLLEVTEFLGKVDVSAVSAAIDLHPELHAAREVQVQIVERALQAAATSARMRTIFRDCPVVCSLAQAGRSMPGTQPWCIICAERTLARRVSVSDVAPFSTNCFLACAVASSSRGVGSHTEKSANCGSLGCVVWMSGNSQRI